MEKKNKVKREGLGDIVGIVRYWRVYYHLILNVAYNVLS